MRHYLHSLTVKNILLWVKPYHPQIYVAGLSLAVLGMPLSKVLMSISMFVLLFNWLTEGELNEKIRLFLNNKTAVVIASLFLLHIAGVVWTSDFAYAFKDLKNKIPILLLPLILSSTPVPSEKNFRIILHIFLLGLFSETVVSIYNLYGFSGKIITNMREITSHVSHIRFSLMLCLGIFSIPYLIHKWNEEYSISQKVLLASLAFWFIFFLVVLQAANGLIIFFITGLFSVFYLAIKSTNTKLKILFLAVILLSLALSFFWLAKIVNDFYRVNEVNIEELETHTALGNPYIHRLDDTRIENGNRVGLYIAWDEMAEAWNQRSAMKFNEKDKNGNMVGFTLERFLTSKGYRKDAEGVAKLTELEIMAINNGVANYRYLDRLSFSDRVYEIIWEIDDYRKTGNASGRSLMQRFEYWKAGWNIFLENKWLGVGTGDLPLAYKTYYEKTNSLLEESFRRRAHNQYLTMAVAFGVFGFLWFLFSLFYPLIAVHFKPGYIYFVFLLIALLSFISEDTLESQAGVTFFAFFNSFFLFCNRLLKHD